MAATVNGDTGHNGILSFLPGQRLSRCTCDGEAHPGPKHSDGTFVGRSAPEIDMFEAQIDQNTLIAGVSQSAQWAVSVTFICRCVCGAPMLMELPNGALYDIAIQPCVHLAEYKRE